MGRATRAETSDLLFLSAHFSKSEAPAGSRVPPLTSIPRSSHRRARLLTVLHTETRSPPAEVTSEALKSWWSGRPRARQHSRKLLTSLTLWKPFLSSVSAALDSAPDVSPHSITSDTRFRSLPFLSSFARSCDGSLCFVRPSIHSEALAARYSSSACLLFATESAILSDRDKNV